MLEGLAIWFLNNYLGKYLENLDPDQLSISLLSGEVELENVPLRKDALSFLQGLELKRGLVGHIRLTIPVSSLGTEPWCLSLQGVNIIVGPKRNTSRMQRFEPTLLPVEKEIVEAEEEVEEQEVEEIIEKESPAPTGWLNYGRLNIRTIVENLQLEVKDINIRYEDSLTTVGVAVESLTGLDISIDFQVTRFLAQQFFPFPSFLDSRGNNSNSLVVSPLRNKVEHFSLAHNVTMMLSQWLPSSRW